MGWKLKGIQNSLYNQRGNGVIKCSVVILHDT